MSLLSFTFVIAISLCNLSVEITVIPIQEDNGAPKIGKCDADRQNGVQERAYFADLLKTGVIRKLTHSCSSNRLVL